MVGESSRLPTPADPKWAGVQPKLGDGDCRGGYTQSRLRVSGGGPLGSSSMLRIPDGIYMVMGRPRRNIFTEIPSAEKGEHQPPGLSPPKEAQAVILSIRLPRSPQTIQGLEPSHSSRFLLTYPSYNCSSGIQEPQGWRWGLSPHGCQEERKLTGKEPSREGHKRNNSRDQRQP